MMELVDRGVAYRAAHKHYTEATATVTSLRSQLLQAEEVQRKAEMERNRTQRMLIESAQG